MLQARIDGFAVKGFDAKARNSAINAAPLAKPEKQKGLWSYLTWPFFLAQALAAAGFFSGSAEAAEDVSTRSSDTAGPRSDDLAVGGRGLSSRPGDGDGNGAPADASAQADAAPAEFKAVQPAPVKANGDVPALAQSSDASGSSSAVQFVTESQGTGPDNGPAPIGGPDGTPPGPIIPPITDVIPPITDVIHDVVETTTETVTEILNTVTEVVESVAETIVETVQSVVEIVDQVLETVTGAVQSLVEPVVEAVGSVIEVADQVLGTVTDAVHGIIDPVVGTVESVIQAVDPVLETVSGVVQGVTEPVVETLGSVIQAVDPVLESVTDVVQGVTEPVVETLESALDSVEPVVEAVTDTVHDIADTVVGLVDSVQPALPLPALAGGEAVGGLLSTVVEMVGGLTGDVSQILSPVTSLVQDITQESSGLGQVLGAGTGALGQTASATGADSLGIGVQLTVVADSPVFDALTESGGTAGGGTILFPSVPVLGIGDVLFNSDGYTNYGLSLQAGPQEGDGVAAEASAGSELDILSVLPAGDGDLGLDDGNLLASIEARVVHSSLFGHHGLL